MEGFSKRYRRLQVEFAPGVYAGCTLISTYILLASNSWLLFLFSLSLVAFILFFDKPFRFLLSKSLMGLIFFVLFFSIPMLSALVLTFFQSGSAMLDFLGILSLPVGGVLTFIFVWKFYTYERLDKTGWVNISGRFN